MIHSSYVYDINTLPCNCSFSHKKYVSTNRHIKPDDFREQFEELHNRLVPTAEAISNNEKDIKNCTDKIERIHEEMRENLDSFVKSQLKESDHKQGEDMVNLKNRLDVANSRANDDQSCLQIRHDIVQSEVNHSKNIQNVLDKSNVSVP